MGHVLYAVKKEEKKNVFQATTVRALGTKACQRQAICIAAQIRHLILMKIVYLFFVVVNKTVEICFVLFFVFVCVNVNPCVLVGASAVPISVWLRFMYLVSVVVSTTGLYSKAHC